MKIGNAFEDFSVGQEIVHATPRTITSGDISLYIGLTGDRRALSSSAVLGQENGWPDAMVPELLTFHVVFGKSVPDISYHAVANLGYADVQFKKPVFPGDTLSVKSTVTGVRETSKKTSGVVYVRTSATNQKQEEVMSFNRFVLVRKKDASVVCGEKVVPSLPKEAEELPTPSFTNSCLDSFHTASGAFRSPYEVGQVIRHEGGMVIGESDHMIATRLYQNTAKVHFDKHRMSDSRHGKPLVYGGHIVSLASSLSYEGLEHFLYMSAWNSGAHCNPTFAGDTVYAVTEVLDAKPVASNARLTALRLRLLAVKNLFPEMPLAELRSVSEEGKVTYPSQVVLDLDYWGIFLQK